MVSTEEMTGDAAGEDTVAATVVLQPIVSPTPRQQAKAKVKANPLFQKAPAVGIADLGTKV